MKKLITFSLIASISAGYLYYDYDKARYLSSTCRATLNYYNSDDINNDFSMYADIAFTFHKNKTGTVFISGDAVYQGQRYVIHKRENFEYEHIDNNNYTFSINQSESLFKDGIQNDIMDKYLPSLIVGTSRSITLEMINVNTLLISNRYAPVLTCVIDQ